MSKIEIPKSFGAYAFADKPRVSETMLAVSHDNVEWYASKVLAAFEKCLFDDTVSSGLTDYHLDKTTQYYDMWAEAGCDVRRACIIYLLTYTRYFRDEQKPNSARWVIENYELFSWVLRQVEIEQGMLLDEDYKLKRVVVTAANRYILPGDKTLLLVGARHWSRAMHLQWDQIKPVLKTQVDEAGYIAIRESEEQGFIDQWDEFLTRFQAYVVARMAKQLNVRRPKSGSVNEPILWSEDIH